MLLWRGPPGELRPLNPGSSGAHVAWVDRQLGRWEGQADPGRGNGAYTAALEQRVRAFQRAHGLKEDGVAGSMTMVRLASVAQPGTPVLAESP
jgi:general secretion pathway protein A